MSNYVMTRLAEVSAGTRYDALGPDQVHEIKRAVLDYVGCALGAWRMGIGGALVATLTETEGAREATIWGAGDKVPAPHAALAVGAIASHLELDTHADMIPAAFAVAEFRHATGSELIAALSSGFAVAAAMKVLLAAEIEAHGLHWPAQIGAYAAAAAACRLQDASVEQTAAALSFAGCLAPVAPFEAFTQGAGAKDFYGGWCSLLGIWAARLSAVGFGGPINLIEGKRGLGRAWLHAPVSADAPRIEAAIHASQSGPKLHFKRYAACMCAHPALSALETLIEQNPDLNVDAIERVEIGTYDYAVDLSEASSGGTPVSAKVSIPYLAAALLLDGEVGPQQTEMPRLGDPRLRRLADRISVSVLPHARAGLDHRTRPALADVLLRDGTRLRAEALEPKWMRSGSVSNADIEEKFRNLVGSMLLAEQCNRLVEMLWNLDAMADASLVVEQTVVHRANGRT